jgi:hypothetical protein
MRAMCMALFNHFMLPCMHMPGLFAGAALFISVVEHPAAMQASTSAFYQYFPHMYARCAGSAGCSFHQLRFSDQTGSDTPISTPDSGAHMIVQLAGPTLQSSQLHPVPRWSLQP